DTDEMNAERFEQVEEGVRLGEVDTSASWVAAEGVAVALAERFRFARAVRAGAEGNPVKGAEAHADFETGRTLADSGDDFAQEAGAVFEAAAVATGAVNSGEKFVTEVAVTVLEV